MLSCYFNFENQEGDCDSEDRITVSWIAQWDGSYPVPSDCQSGENTFPCFSAMKLNFFTYFNFIITTLIITVIYFFKKKALK